MLPFLPEDTVGELLSQVKNCGGDAYVITEDDGQMRILRVRASVKPLDNARTHCRALWEDSPGSELHQCVRDDDHDGLCRCDCGDKCDWGNP